MPGTYFISDLHLDSARPAGAHSLRAFLRQIAGAEALYILGDLFESWVGDDDDAPLASATCELLREFASAGPAVFVMHGNRDFLLGEGFCARAGVTLLPEPTVIELCGRRTLLLHGDSLCTGDVDYQAFRRLARTDAWRADMLARPLPERRALAGQLRAMSREAGSRRAGDIVDTTPAAVDATMASHRAEQLIHGHTHRPARHDTPGGPRWVLGDWDPGGWYLRAVGDSMELKYHYYSI